MILWRRVHTFFNGFVARPRTDFNFDSGDRVHLIPVEQGLLICRQFTYSVRTPYGRCLAFRHADVVDFAPRDKAGQDLDSILYGVVVVYSSTFKEVELLRPAEL